MQYGPRARQESEQPKLSRFLIVLHFGRLGGGGEEGMVSNTISRKEYENGGELNITDLQRQNGRMYKDALFKFDCTGNTIYGRCHPSSFSQGKSDILSGSIHITGCSKVCLM